MPSSSPQTLTIAASTSRARPGGSRGRLASSGLRDSKVSAETHAASSAAPLAQALRDQQVKLGVQAGQPRALRRHRVAVGVSELIEHRAHPVERPRDDVRPARHPAFQGLGLPLQAEVPFRLPGMLVAVRAAMARVLTQPPPQPLDLRVAPALPARPAPLGPACPLGPPAVRPP